MLPDSLLFPAAIPLLFLLFCLPAFLLILVGCLFFPVLLLVLLIIAVGLFLLVLLRLLYMLLLHLLILFVLVLFPVFAVPWIVFAGRRPISAAGLAVIPGFFAVFRLVILVLFLPHYCICDTRGTPIGAMCQTRFYAFTSFFIFVSAIFYANCGTPVIVPWK